MATKLKNIIRNSWLKTLLYLVFGVLVFIYCFYTINNILCDENSNYFKNYTYESFLVDDFYESSYSSSTLGLGLVNIGQLAEEFSLESYQKILSKDKINYIDKNFEFQKDSNLFAFDEKYSYYFETTDGYAFASGKFNGISKEKIKEKIKKDKLYVWYDYRIDEMGMDGDSSSLSLKAELNNRDMRYYYLYKGYENIRIMYLSYDDKILQIAIDEWELAHSHYERMKENMWAIFLAALLVLILLFGGAGRTPKSEEKIEFYFDPIFIEIKLAALIPLYYLLGKQILSFFRILPSDLKIISISASLLVCATMYLSLIVLMSVVRNLKSDNVKNRFLITWIARTIVGFVKFIAEFFKAIFETKNLSEQNLNKKIHKYIMLYILFSFILMFITFVFLMNREKELFFLFSAIEVIFTILFIVKIKRLLVLSNKAFDKRVIEASRSEKTKTELITNVSHDLKTPLTSIIGYVDLLKNEEMSDVARDYVKILEQKSHNLKDIIADLFVLSKSESGSMDINIEVIDLKKLVNQTLADMDDKIRDSEMQIKTKLPEEGVYIKADGKKLYRVLQNLIDNALKYSLQGTRIFIDLDLSIDNKGIFKIKNTSSYEMDFTKEEITSRFVRGDKSRSKEGSGLGLAIAESFTTVLGGEFDIKIDGDVFSVEIKFPMT